MSLIFSANAKGFSLLINIIVAFVLSGLLAVAVISSKFQYILPEFSELEITFSVPLIFQLILFSIFIVLSILYIFKKKNFLMLLGVLLLFITVLVSTYSFTISHRSNSISSAIGPFTINNIDFSDDLIIKKNWYGYEISNSVEALQYPTNIFLFGFSANDIYKEYVEMGECMQKDQSVCLEIDIAWP